MSKSPLVSVIMPAYNVEQYIRQAIDSILNQTYQNIELLIADDKSTDNTKDIIDQYSDNRIIELHNDVNLGYLETCNKLFKHAKGTFVTFQDADDYSSLDRIQKQLQAFDNDPDLSMCGTFAYTVTRERKNIRSINKPISYDNILNEIPYKNAFFCNTVMVRSEIYKDIGGYRMFFNQKGYQDYDWTFLIVEKYKSVNLPEYLYFYRQHGASNSKKAEVDRLLGIKYVQFLGEQRKNNQGKDALSEISLLPEFETYLQKIKSPYLYDKSLIFREYAANCMYQKLYKDAINKSLNAIRLEPFKLINYRTYIYCFRKSLFKA